jgi:D-lactate dehydrogenase
MKIAYITPNKGEEEIVTNLLSEHEVVFIHEPLFDTVPENILEVEVLSIFVNSKLTKEMLDTMPNLKVIALRSTGFDHVAVAEAKARGIIVTYVPHYGSQTVAEYTFGLMLSLSRRVNSMYELLRHEGSVDVERFEGFDLSGKTLGVIGTGAIGKKVCEIAHGFNMQVVAYDIYPDDTFADKEGFRYGSLDEVLQVADVLTFHVPATDDNYHMLNAETIAKMKSGAYVINTARGVLIDTVALIRALKSGHLAGAGLDVFEGEEYLKDEMKLLDSSNKNVDESVYRSFVVEHELLDMENVIMTPHMAFNTKEAKQEITETTIENIKKAIAGEVQFEVKLD